MNKGNCSEIYFRFKKIYEVIMKQILRKRFTLLLLRADILGACVCEDEYLRC